jgi:hypothetical protein
VPTQATVYDSAPSLMTLHGRSRFVEIT